MRDPSSSPHEITQLLDEWSKGNQTALDKLYPLVDDELHRMARRYMNRERQGHTLQTTALINEAYVRLVDQKHVHWENRAIIEDGPASDLLLLDEALNRLAELDPRRSQVVELRYFGGLNNEEISGVLKISENTVTRDWNMARAWLYQELSGSVA